MGERVMIGDKVCVVGTGLVWLLTDYHHEDRTVTLERRDERTGEHVSQRYPIDNCRKALTPKQKPPA